jgi:ADP-heptose:LPS heptosyltransferase
MLPRQEIQSIIIFRALQLGDLLCSMPAFRALRTAFPQAHIAITGLPWQKTLLERFPAYFDEFILFPGYPGLPEQPVNAETVTRFLLDVNERKFDFALQMQGNGSIVNPMVELFGAKYTAGYFEEKDYTPSSAFFLKYPDGISEVHRHLRLMNHLGIDSTGDDLEFPLTESDYRDLQSIPIDIFEGRYICVHPGSRGSYRQWPPESFANAAEQCISKGYDIVLTGTPNELDIVNEVNEFLNGKAVIAAGKTNLGSMGALLKNSGGLISNCTGVSHMASALQVKSVVISMDGEPERWAPLNTTRHFMIDWLKHPDHQLVTRTIHEHFPTLT